MLLQVVTALLNPGDTGATFTVPGHEIWTPRAVYAVADRGVGGTPNRAYTLSIITGDQIVAQVGALDAGAEPGVCNVTFANTPAASVAAGSIGITVAPLAPIRIPAGYVISVTIDNPVAGDEWESAVCWTDFAYAS